MPLPLIQKEQANQAQLNVLSQADKHFGFVPNLIKKLANTPVVAQAYLSLSDLFAKSSFNETEQQVILLTVSRYHECDYCMAAHSAVATMQGVSQDVITALRCDASLENAKLNALRLLTNDIVINRGNPKQKRIDAFIAAGYSTEQILEILLGISMKVLSNYCNHIVETPLDEVLEGHQWGSKK